jgi:hypothetical protein
VTFFGYIETSQHNELTSRKAHPVQDSENAMDFVLTDNNAGRKYGVAIDRSIDRSTYRDRSMSNNPLILLTWEFTEFKSGQPEEARCSAVEKRHDDL